MITALEKQDKPGFPKIWWVAIRPFALPASTMPVIFGTVLAVTIGEAKFNLIHFLGALFGMAALHTGANLLNDVFDYKKGLDARVNPVSGAIVRGWISTRQATGAAALFFAMGIAIGIKLVDAVGMPVLWLGVLGVAIGLLYSLGSVGLKYHALGDPAVFLNFGILGSLGAWTVQTGSHSWIPAVWAIPMSMLVVGILHSNNWRDIKSDSDGGISTMATLLGDRVSQFYYGVMIFGPFAVVLAIMGVSWFLGLGHRMPLTFLITLLALPLAVGLMKKGSARHNASNPLDFLALDGATAKLNLVFGLLCTGALGLHVLVSQVCAG